MPVYMGMSCPAKELRRFNESFTSGLNVVDRNLSNFPSSMKEGDCLSQNKQYIEQLIAKKILNNVRKESMCERGLIVSVSHIPAPSQM